MRKKIFLRLTALLISFLALISFFSVFTYAAEDSFPDTSEADAVFLYNINTNKLIYSQGFENKIFTGSVTKMMCGMVFCEQFSSKLGDSVKITSDMLKNVSGAKIRLTEGDTVSFKDLLYGAICGGGNDACYALAIACCGSVDKYVSLMNETVASWSADNTVFTNPSGYDDVNMQTTAEDVLIISKRAYQNELYMEVSSSLSYTIKPLESDKEIKIFNRNSLISSYYASGYQNKYAYGLIAGFTDLGQYTAITYLEKDGTEFLCGVMGAKDVPESKDILSYKYVNDIAEYAFSHYKYKKIFEGGKYICTLDVGLALPKDNADSATVSCYSEDDVYALINPSASTENDIVYGYYLHDKKLSAPIAEDSVLGGVDIFYKGELVGSTKLVTGESVEENRILYTLNSMKRFFMGRFFILSAIFFVALTAVYIFIDLRKSPKKVTKPRRKDLF